MHVFYIAHGTFPSTAAGIVKDLFSEALELKFGQGPDDKPIITVKLDTG